MKPDPFVMWLISMIVILIAWALVLAAKIMVAKWHLRQTDRRLRAIRAEREAFLDELDRKLIEHRQLSRR